MGRARPDRRRPARPDARLDDFVLAAYLDSGRTDDAAALVWDRFETRPSPATYARLRTWATNADRWSDLRLKELDLLRAEAERAAQTVTTARSTAARRWGTSPPPPAPYRTLTEVLLGDGEVEAALQLAVEHGCPQRLWMSLARTREDEHRLDAVSVYQREIEDLVDRKQTHSYEQAVAHVVHVGELYKQAGAEDDFTTYLEDLRHRHKPKTKFLAMLAAAVPG